MILFWETILLVNHSKIIKLKVRELIKFLNLVIKFQFFHSRKILELEDMLGNDPEASPSDSAKPQPSGSWIQPRFLQNMTTFVSTRFQLSKLHYFIRAITFYLCLLSAFFCAKRALLASAFYLTLMNFHVPCSISYSFKIHPSYLLNTFGENLVGQKLLLFGENEHFSVHFDLTKKRLSLAKLKAPSEVCV